MVYGRTNEFPYIQHLADHYLRSRVDHMLRYETGEEEEATLTVANWAKDHKHFKELRRVDPSGVLAAKVEAAVKGFVSRICPALMFTTPQRLDASLEEVV